MSNSNLLQRIRNPHQLPTSTLVLSKLVLCVVPIVDIVIGAVYLDDCPRQHYIPIYLIVVGVFALMLGLLSCLPCAHEPKDGPPNPLSQVCRAWNSLILFFLLCWFIAGNVWVYSIYAPNYNKSTTDVDPYCDQTLYMFAFWTITSVYILIGISLAGALCSLIFSRQSGQADTNDDV